MGKYLYSSRSSTIVDNCNNFEVKVFRTKLRVFGKKKSLIAGSPGYKRYKGDIKRKKILLTQFRERNCCNNYSDKRIGNKTKSMCEDESMLHRLSVVNKLLFKTRKNYSSVENTTPDLINSDTSYKLNTYIDLSSDEDKFDTTRHHFGGGFLALSKISGCKHNLLMKQRMASSDMVKYGKQLEYNEQDPLYLVNVQWSQIKNRIDLISKDIPLSYDSFDILVQELSNDMKISPHQNRCESFNTETPSIPHELASYRSLDSLDSYDNSFHNALFTEESLVYDQGGNFLSTCPNINNKLGYTAPKVIKQLVENNTGGIISGYFRSEAKIRDPCESIILNHNDLQKAKEVIFKHINDGKMTNENESFGTDNYPDQYKSSETIKVFESEHIYIQNNIDTHNISQINVITNASDHVFRCAFIKITIFLDRLLKLTPIHKNDWFQEICFDTIEKLLEIGINLTPNQMNPLESLNIIDDLIFKIYLLNTKYVFQFFLEKLKILRKFISFHRMKMSFFLEYQIRRITLNLHIMFTFFKNRKITENLLIKTALSLSCELLSNCSFNNFIEISFLLFLIDSIKNYFCSSFIYFLPEALAFLSKLFLLLSSRTIPIASNLHCIYPINSIPFEANGKAHWNFIFTHRIDLVPELASILLYNGLFLMIFYSRHYTCLSCYNDLFYEICVNLEILATREKLFGAISLLIEDILFSIKNVKFTKTSLHISKINLKTIKFLELDFLKSYSNSENKLTKSSDSKRLRKNFEKEFKGALMEIRKDNTFLSNEKFRLQKIQDLRRFEDVKTIEDTILGDKFN